jgi:hypothetical protein
MTPALFAQRGGYPHQGSGAGSIEAGAPRRYRSGMADETSAPARTRFTGRVWLVLLSALSVAVFLAIVLPGVFDLRHEKRSLEIKKPIKRLALESKGDTKVEIEPSRDGHVHFLRTSSVSKDSRIVERVKISGKTLKIHSSCTGSRLGILRRCDLAYHLRVPKTIALALRLHFGKTTLRGLQGPLDFKLDAGKLEGFGCNKQAGLYLRFGSIDYRDTCVPKHLRARVKAGELILAIPAGRYDVRAGSEAQRPFANIIEDPSSPSKINVDVVWGGSVQITGVRR